MIYENLKQSETKHFIINYDLFQYHKPISHFI